MTRFGRGRGPVPEPSHPQILYLGAVCAALFLVVAACDRGSVRSRVVSPSDTPFMTHATDTSSIIPGLCELRDRVAAGDKDAYEYYSSSIHDSLHALMNSLQDRDPRGTRSLIRAENQLEISLLSGAPRRQLARGVTRVIKLLGEHLAPGRHQTCHG